MTHPRKLTTSVSTKGQVILPMAIRRQKGWAAGTRLVVEDTTDGVLLRPARPFPATKPADVFGMLPAPDRPKTLDEMEAGILAEAKRRHAGN